MQWLGGLLAAGLICAVTSLGVSWGFFPLTRTVVDTVKGEALFQQRCASCHSLDGAARYGPSLRDIGHEAGRRFPDQSAPEYLLESIVDPTAKKSPNSQGEMPRAAAAGLSMDDLRNLVAFLWKQGGQVSHATLLNLPVQATKYEKAATRVVALAELERGRELFLGKLQCIRCHPLDTAVGSDLLAPSLWQVGLHSQEYLRAAILKPSEKISPSYEQWQVLANGVPHTGRRLPANSAVVRLLRQDVNVGVRLDDYEESELEPFEDGTWITRIEGSLMPSFGEQLSEEDLDALLAFLSTLR